MLLQEVRKAGINDLGALQQRLMARPRHHLQPFLGQVVPTIHRARGDEVVFRREQQHRQLEGAQAWLRRAPVGNHVNAAPLAARVTSGAGMACL